MTVSNAMFLLSLVFFLSAGVFFAAGQGTLAAVDVALGLAVGGFAWWRRRKDS